MPLERQQHAARPRCGELGSRPEPGSDGASPVGAETRVQRRFKCWSNAARAYLQPHEPERDDARDSERHRHGGSPLSRRTTEIRAHRRDEHHQQDQGNLVAGHGDDEDAEPERSATKREPEGRRDEHRPDHGGHQETQQLIPSTVRRSTTRAGPAAVPPTVPAGAPTRNPWWPTICCIPAGWERPGTDAVGLGAGRGRSSRCTGSRSGCGRRSSPSRPRRSRSTAPGAPRKPFSCWGSGRSWAGCSRPSCAADGATPDRLAGRAARDASLQWVR